MSRLTKEEEEEIEYYNEHHPHPHAGVNPKQYAEPAGPQRPQSAYERVVSAVKNVHGKLQEVDRSPTGQAVRRHAQGLNAQQGLGGGQAGGSGNRMQQYARFTNDSPSQPENQGSTRIAGRRIIVVEGSVLASAQAPGAAPAEPRRRAPPRGGLGAIDTGFDNDRGL